MSKRIRTFFQNNLSLKILALFLSAVLWLLVYNIEDPTKTTSYTIAVTITNADSVSDMNKCYEIINGSSQITFAVQAKRTVLDKLSESDFSAVADMSNMTISENGEVGSVPIVVTVGKLAASVKLVTRTKYLEVSLEDMQTRQFVVTAGYKGKVAEGYALGTVSIANPNVLKVSGPASIVDSIDHVSAVIDVDGMSQNISDNVIPVLYDADDNEIPVTRLSISNTTVTVQAIILNTKEVSLSFSYKGIPADGYMVKDIKSSITSVEIKGTSSILNNITSVAVPASTLDVTDASEDITTTIDITEYLPDSVELVDSSQAKVSVTVDVEEYESKTISIQTSGLQAENLAEGLTLQYNLSTVTFTVRGSMADLNKIDSSNVSGSIDLSGIEAGSYMVPIVFNLDKEKYICSNTRVSITISEE